MLQGFIPYRLIYWKYVSGHWLVYSYQDQKLDLKSPHFFNYTLSYRCGWLTYSPTMFFCFYRYPAIFEKREKQGGYTYFFSCLIIISYARGAYGGMGGRAMVQSYPVLLLCIAALIQARNGKKIAIMAICPYCFFICLL